MKKYLGEELIEILTPNFTTTNYDSTIVCKISIMGAFKKYFDYKMGLCGCGLPYIILEGNAEDYKKIISKAEKLKKYDFEWYINRIIPDIQKMVEAKEGKIDVNFFKNFVQKKEITEMIGLSGMEEGEEQVEYISGWLLHFFAYFNDERKFVREKMKVELFDELANQMLIVSFTVEDLVQKKTYLMKYKVGFVGCDKNEKNEVFPVQGWLVSPSTKEERESRF